MQRQIRRPSPVIIRSAQRSSLFPFLEQMRNEDIDSINKKIEALVEEDNAAAGRLGKIEDLLKTILRSIANVEEMVAQVQKQEGPPGAPGAPGAHAPVVDESALHDRIVQRVIKSIPAPKLGNPGKSVDPEVVAEMVRARIEIPQPKNPPTLEEIMDELMKKKLPLSLITGLEEKFAEVRRAAALGGQVRGGGDTIAAGTNITITASNGVKTITASSGGFSQLAATETPDGNVTVFTFASATAQPTFIVSDNVIMKATTKAGTVNWTWNAGLKQATMTIAPQDEIYAIV